MASYKQSKTDMEYLETLADLTDWVDIDSDMRALLNKPSKAHAAELFESAIILWMREHKDRFDEPRVRRIARRYGEL